MTDAEIYQAAKAEVVVYLESLSADELATQCAHCPAWSLKEVLAHHTHVLRVLSTGGSIPMSARTAIVEPSFDLRVEAVQERDLWMQKGVDERQNLSLEGLVHEWSEVVEMMSEDNAFFILDLSVHYDDLRETVGGQTSRSGADLQRSLELFHGFQNLRMKKAGHDLVSLVCTDTGERLGSIDGPSVAGTTYDLLRVMASRRTRPVANRIIDWSETGAGSIQTFPVYGWPEEPGGG